MPNWASSSRRRFAASKQDGPAKPLKSVLVVPSGFTVTSISLGICDPPDDYLCVFLAGFGGVAHLLERRHGSQADIRLNNLLLELVELLLYCPRIAFERECALGV